MKSGHQKCIVIGSGLGGLASGLIMARNGYDVTILEQNRQIGGCMQCFARGNAKFETGMHFIGSALPGQNLYRFMRWLGIADIELKALDTSAYDRIKLCGQIFDFANGKDPFIESLAARFPAEKDALVRYFDIITEIAGASSLRKSLLQPKDYAINPVYHTVAINTVLDSLFKDELLKNVLAGNQPLYAPRKNHTPFSQHAFIADFYNQSAFRIVNGSDMITAKLKSLLQEYNTTILTNSKVTKIICDDSKAIGVEVNNERFLKTDIIISDIHPAALLRLIDSRTIRPAYRKRVTSLRNTPGCFAVYLKFKDGCVPYMNSNFYSYREDSPWDCENYMEETWPKGYLYMHFCQEKEPVFAKTGVVLSYMNMDELKPWHETLTGRRGDSYETFKRMKAQSIISRLEEDFPGISSKIETFFTSTPLTYRDYTGTENGSMYGIEKDIALDASGRVSYRTKIPNLFLTGQNINSHGMLGVIIGSIVTCSEILSAETIYEQIRDANNE